MTPYGVTQFGAACTWSCCSCYRGTGPLHYCASRDGRRRVRRAQRKRARSAGRKEIDMQKFDKEGCES